MSDQNWLFVGFLVDEFVLFCLIWDKRLNLVVNATNHNAIWDLFPWKIGIFKLSLDWFRQWRVLMTIYFDILIVGLVLATEFQSHNFFKNDWDWILWAMIIHLRTFEILLDLYLTLLYGFIFLIIFDTPHNLIYSLFSVYLNYIILKLFLLSRI